MAITLEAIRAAGGIVHSDGNIFFRDISMLQGLAGAAPAAVAPLPAALEQIAQGWDGCKYDAPGETLDIGADIRAAAKRLLAEQPAAMAGPTWGEQQVHALAIHMAASAPPSHKQRDYDADMAWARSALSFIAGHAPAAPALEAPAAPESLIAAAKDFYNGTVADPKIKISATCPDARDHVKHLGERLREEILAALAAAPQAPAAPAYRQILRVDTTVDLEDDPVEGMDYIMSVYERSMGKTAPDAEMGEVVELTKDHLLTWWAAHREDIRAALVAAQDEAAPAAPAVDARDTARMNWLEAQVVNVRAPLRYGSRDLFWASPEEVDGGPDGPSDLRARIDAAQAAAKGEHAA